MSQIIIKDALILPLFWLLTFAFITSVGYAIVPFKQQKGVLSNNLFTWFWYGLGITIGFLQIWNLFLAVNLYAWLFLLPIAILGFGRMMRTRIQFTLERPHWLLLMLCFLILVFLINSSLDNTFIFDVRVYHFMSIKWLNSYPVIPGLGNLFILLGYNESFFLFPSFLNSLWSDYKGMCSVNGLLAIAICAEIILTNAKRIVDQKLTFSSAFQLLFLPLCINIGVQNLSSPTPDVFVSLLTFKIFSDLIICLETQKVTVQDLFLLAFYCVLGVVMKLSFIGVALGVIPVILILLFKVRLAKFKFILQSCLIFLWLLIPWLIRGYISTGYFLFPLTLFAMPVDWRAPIMDVKKCADFIKGFSRSSLHGQGAFDAVHGFKWLPGWIKRTFTSVGFVVPVGLFLGVSTFLRIKKRGVTPLMFVVAPLFIAIIFWFITAPDLRFVRFTFWTLGLGSFAYLLSVLNVRWQRPFSVIIGICCILIMVRNWNSDMEPLGDLGKPHLTKFKTKSGLKVNVVKDMPPNDVWTTDGCPIPCSTYPDSNLMLRGKELRQGFRNSIGDKKTRPFWQW